MTKKKISSIDDVVPDRHNANRGTERGKTEVWRSIKDRGTGRSILIDAEGNIIAGNKTAEAAKAAGIKEIIVVENDGSRLIAVQRTDLDLADQDPNNPARRLAYDDNRAGELGLDWDPDVLIDDLESGADLGGLWEEWEIEELKKERIEFGPVDTRNKYFGHKAGQIKAILYVDQIGVFEEALAATGLKNRGEAITAVCQYYLDEQTKRQLDSPVKNLFTPADFDPD